MICPHDFCWFLSLVSKWEHTHVQDSKLIKCSSQNLMLNRSITCQRLAKIIFNKLIILRNVLQPEVSILLQSAVFSSICSHSLQYLAWSRVNIESPFCFLRTITDRTFAPEQATWSTAGVLLGFLPPKLCLFWRVRQLPSYILPTGAARPSLLHLLHFSGVRTGRTVLCSDPGSRSNSYWW